MVLVRESLTLGCATSETGHPEDCQEEPDYAGDDPNRGKHEQEDDADDDECDPHTDHTIAFPVRREAETC
jgi:hypothetical protein